MSDAEHRAAEASGCPACHQRHTPRSEEELRQLKNRLNRMVGQLNGIGRMLDENRYCGDILIQISAVEKALQGFGYSVLKSHMENCVVEEVRNGNPDIMDETLELMKKLK
ncbi:MAG: metal-sensing transcriptional repressor [Clostridia bacterium]|nr:metal-sensing transcriptional repressor [Clostridia bacterium]